MARTQSSGGESDSPDVVVRDGHRRMGALASAVVVGLIGAIAYLLQFVFLSVITDSRPSDFLLASHSMLAFNALLIGLWVLWILKKVRSAGEAQQSAASSLAEARQDVERAETRKDIPLHDVIRLRLRVLSQEGRVQLGKAESKMDQLYWVGTVLVFLAVGAPIGATALYLGYDPVPADVRDFAFEWVLAQQVGESPPTALSPSLQLEFSRDWRILFSGVSFGLLYLGAAASLFVQLKSQNANYFAISRRVDFYNAVIEAVQIRNEADQEDLSAGMESVISRVIDDLLSRHELAASKRSVEGLDPAHAAPLAAFLTQAFRHGDNA